jgi:FeS assembly protein IscX
MDWTDYSEIGAALARAYPDENHVMLSDEEVIALVQKLPGFTDGPRPAVPDMITAIRAVWIESVSDEPDDAAPQSD